MPPERRVSQKVTKFPAVAKLDRRETVEVELPLFLIRALEHRVQEANAGAPEEERVDLRQLIEFELAASVSIADVARLESDIPGLTAAVAVWAESVR